MAEDPRPGTLPLRLGEGANTAAPPASELSRRPVPELARLAKDGPTLRELDEAKNSIEASFLRGIHQVAGKAGRLNAYFYQTGTPDSFQADLDRYKAVSAADIQRVVRQYLRTSRVMASVVPQARLELAAKQAVIQ